MLGREHAVPRRDVPCRGPLPRRFDPGYLFARSLASAGPRPAASAQERHAQLRVARVFKDAGLQVGFERFSVPGKGRSVLAAQREALVELRNEGSISNQVMNRVVREIDLEESRLEI